MKLHLYMGHTNQKDCVKKKQPLLKEAANR